MKRVSYQGVCFAIEKFYSSGLPKFGSKRFAAKINGAQIKAATIKLMVVKTMARQSPAVAKNPLMIVGMTQITHLLQPDEQAQPSWQNRRSLQSQEVPR